MSNAVLFSIVVVLVLFDQVTKLTVKGFSFLGFTHEGMYLGQSIPVLGDVVRWTFVENPGMAFGISFGAGKIVLTLLTFLIVGFLIWYLRALKHAHNGVRFAVMLVLSGAIGNLIDRAFYGVLYGEAPLFYGKVVDFVQVDIPDITIFGEMWSHFPVFNVADSCVSVGIVLLIIFSNAMPTPSMLRSTKPENDHEQG
ncbi:MAG: signal peptidase II [Candidatus Kapabacteria bacterium]|jgi:signal peptidase II|nr:signal peptidase II [Candidatus Kapabacteria bacterium]